MNSIRPTIPTLSSHITRGWTPETIAPQASAQPSNLLLDQNKIINRYGKNEAPPWMTAPPRLPGTYYEKVGMVGRISRNDCAATIFAVQPLISGLGIVQPKVGCLRIAVCRHR